MAKLLRTQHGVVLDVGQLMAVDPQEARGTYWLAAVMKSGDDFMLMKPTSDVELRAKVFENLVAYWAIESAPSDTFLLAVKDIVDGKVDTTSRPEPRKSSIKPSTVPARPGARTRAELSTSAGFEPDGTIRPPAPEGDHKCNWYVMLTSEKTGAPTAWECFEHETRLREHPAQDCETPSCCSGEDPF